MRYILPMLALLCLPFTHAATITSLVGDKDNLGGAISPGATSFTGNFENRSAAELSAIDGSQNTDFSNGPSGTTLANVTFIHNFSINASANITSASFVMGAGGIQSNNDQLFLDGVLIASGAAFPEQGSNGYSGNIVFNIPTSSFAALLDGNVTVLVKLNSNESGEPAVFDFGELVINGDNLGGGGGNPVPEPSSLILFGSGLILMIWRKKK